MLPFRVAGAAVRGSTARCHADEVSGGAHTGRHGPGQEAERAGPRPDVARAGVEVVVPQPELRGAQDGALVVDARAGGPADAGAPGRAALLQMQRAAGNQAVTPMM